MEVSERNAHKLARAQGTYVHSGSERHRGQRRHLRGHGLLTHGRLAHERGRGHTAVAARRRRHRSDGHRSGSGDRGHRQLRREARRLLEEGRLGGRVRRVCGHSGGRRHSATERGGELSEAVVQRLTQI
jgi:hypothetical protein